VLPNFGHADSFDEAPRRERRIMGISAAAERSQRTTHAFASSSVDACFDLLTARAPTIAEDRLMLAILLDAVIQLQRRGTVSAAAATSWIRGEEGMTDATLTFRSICETLQLDADQLARGLLRGVESTPTAVVSPRSHVTAERRRRMTRRSPLLGGGVVFLPFVLALHVIAITPWWLRLAMLGLVPIVILAIGDAGVP
jgi:hypothetical protein